MEPFKLMPDRLHHATGGEGVARLRSAWPVMPPSVVYYMCIEYRSRGDREKRPFRLQFRTRPASQTGLLVLISIPWRSISRPVVFALAERASA